MDNTWYYTLSTIAQTLAAIMGLSVVFVSLRLQNIIENIKEYKRRADYIVKNKNEHIDGNSGKINERSVSGLINELKEIEKDYPEKFENNSGFKPEIESYAKNFNFLDNLSFIKDTAGNLKIYRNQREKLFESTKYPGVIASATIIYAIILLSMSNLFFCDPILGKLLFFLATLFSIISIISIVKTSWILLRDSVQTI